MMSMTCHKLRIFSFTIGVLFLLIQTSFLVLSFVMMRDIEGHTQKILDWLADRGITITNELQDSQNFQTTARLSPRDFIIRKSGDYIAIPITINLILIISDTLLIWAAGARNRILIWPWLLIHLVEFLFFIAVLIYAMVILPEKWFKVVVFLIGCPVIVLLGFFIFVVKSFYNVLRDVSLKKAMAAVYQNGNPHRPFNHNHPVNPPPTVYKPNPHYWDQPPPVWSAQPTHNGWDPEYIQRKDFRHKNGRRRGQRRTDRAVELADGTMVIPIDDEVEQEEFSDIKNFPIGHKFVNSETVDEIEVANSLNEDDSFENDNGRESTTHGSVRSLSTKFGHRQSEYLSTITSAAYTPGSEDRSSVVSLSDKYRNQDEVEVFHDQFRSPKPPEPIRPGLYQAKRFSSQSNPASSNNDSFRQNFRL